MFKIFREIASIKCTTFYASHTIRDDYIRQRTTTRQSQITYACHTIGMTMLDRELQPENAKLSMLVTLSGMIMLDRELQSEYLLSVDYQYYTL